MSTTLECSDPTRSLRSTIAIPESYVPVGIVPPTPPLCYANADIGANQHGMESFATIDGIQKTTFSFAWYPFSDTTPEILAAFVLHLVAIAFVRNANEQSDCQWDVESNARRVEEFVRST